MYKELFIKAVNYYWDNYLGQEGFCNEIKRQMVGAKNKGVEPDEFFKGYDNAILSMIKGIEYHCAYKGDAVKAKLDNQSGIIVDCAQMVNEFNEADREVWRFDKFSYMNNSITKKNDHRIPYNSLISYRKAVKCIYHGIIKDSEEKHSVHYVDVDELKEPLIDDMQSIEKEDNPQRFINLDLLKEYLILEIFTKKGKQRNKAYYLVMLMKSDDLTCSDFAVIAEFLKENNLLKDKYKFSLDWAPWLRIFYSIAGVAPGYDYRPNEAKNDNLTNMLRGLFQI